MEVSVVRDAVTRRPFQPFRFNLADGRAVPVPHSDFVWLEPRGRTCIVALGDGHLELIDVALIQSITLQQAA